MRRISLVISASVLALAMSAGTAFAQCGDPLCTLKTLRTEYPTPMSKEQLGAMLDRMVAEHPGWRLYRKPQGNNCPQPVTGVPISCDIIVQTHGIVGTMYDVLIDQDNAATPSWREVGETDDTEKWIRPVSGSTQPEPPATSQPEPPTTPSDIGERLERIETKLDVHEAEQAKFREGVRTEYKRFAFFLTKYVMPAVVGFFGGRALAN